MHDEKQFVFDTLWAKKNPFDKKRRVSALFLSFRNLVLSELAPSLDGGLPWLHRASPSATLDKNGIQLSERIIVGRSQMSRSEPLFFKNSGESVGNGVKCRTFSQCLHTA